MNLRILIAIITLTVSSTRACICIPDKDIVDSYEKHDFIAVCDITEITVSDDFEDPQLKAVDVLVNVIEPLKGKRGSPFLLTSTYNDCSFSFEEVGRYLLFMKFDGSRLYCMNCSPNELFTESTTEKIEALRKLKEEAYQGAAHNVRKRTP